MTLAASAREGLPLSSSTIRKSGRGEEERKRAKEALENGPYKVTVELK
jgi:hypothetical protein